MSDTGPGPQPSPEVHVVPPDPPRLRVDAYALEVFTQLGSRAHARRAAHRGELVHNGVRADTARFVRAGDELRLTLARPRFQVYERELTFLHVDPHLAVALKPPGLPTSGNRHRTFAHALPPHLPPPALPDALPVPWPVHRLDARTTGLILVARTASARARLGQDLASGAVHKTYRALVVGHLEDGESTDPIDDRAAHTSWRVRRRGRSLHVDWLTELDLTLHTGRTHQIRRHLSARGHPVVGDDLYDDHPLRGHGLFLAAVALDLAHPCRPGRVTVQTDPPHRFGTFLAREQRRWDRHQNH